MTYSADSPITGVGTVTAAQIDAWFAAFGPSYATTYAPDGRYTAPPAIGNSIVGYARLWGINGDLAAAQCLHESAAWQSAIARDKRNPAGLGAENTDSTGTAYDKAITFDTPDLGIRAQIAHLADYARGRGDWTAYDPRASAMPAASFGVATTLSGLDGRWATPGHGYGASIAALANDLQAFAQQAGGTPMGDVPQPDWTVVSGITNKGGYAGTRLVLGVVNHIMVGTVEGTISWFRNPQSQASSNFGIGKDGTIYLFVDPDEAAWANGPMHKPDTSSALVRAIVAAGINPNMLTVSKEFEGAEGDVFTDAQIAASNRLDAWLSQKYGFRLTRDYLIGHYQIDSVNKPFCPGQSEAVWKRLVEGAAEIATSGGQSTSQPTEVVPGVLILPGNPHGDVPVVLGFKGFLEGLAAARYPQDATAAILSIVGYPEAPEYATEDGSAQVFERAVLLYTRGNTPPFDIVLLRREDAIPEAA